MHTHETLVRMNAEWPNPLTPKERRTAYIEQGVRMFEERLDCTVDRDDPMIGAIGAMEMAMDRMLRGNK